MFTQHVVTRIQQGIIGCLIVFFATKAIFWVLDDYVTYRSPDTTSSPAAITASDLEEMKVWLKQQELEQQETPKPAPLDRKSSEPKLSLQEKLALLVDEAQNNFEMRSVSTLTINIRPFAETLLSSFFFFFLILVAYQFYNQKVRKNVIKRYGRISLPKFTLESLNSRVPAENAQRIADCVQFAAWHVRAASEQMEQVATYPKHFAHDSERILVEIARVLKAIAKFLPGTGLRPIEPSIPAKLKLEEEQRKFAAERVEFEAEKRSMPERIRVGIESAIAAADLQNRQAALEFKSAKEAADRAAADARQAQSQLAEQRRDLTQRNNELGERERQLAAAERENRRVLDETKKALAAISSERQLNETLVVRIDAGCVFIKNATSIDAASVVQSLRAAGQKPQ